MEKIEINDLPMNQADKVITDFETNFQNFNTIDSPVNLLKYFAEKNEELKKMIFMASYSQRLKDCLQHSQETQVTWDQIEEMELLQNFIFCLRNKGSYVNLSEIESAHMELLKENPLFSGLYQRLDDILAKLPIISSFFYYVSNMFESKVKEIESMLEWSIVVVRRCGDEFEFEITKKSIDSQNTKPYVRSLEYYSEFQNEIKMKANLKATAHERILNETGLVQNFSRFFENLTSLINCLKNMAIFEDRETETQVLTTFEIKKTDFSFFTNIVSDFAEKCEKISETIQFH